jgi:hypothetical protein
VAETVLLVCSKIDTGNILENSYCKYMLENRYCTLIKTNFAAPFNPFPVIISGSAATVYKLHPRFGNGNTFPQNNFLALKHVTRS